MCGRLSARNRLSAMEKDKLIKFLTWPGSTPIERLAAEEILRLREEVERLTTELAIERLQNEPLGS